MKIPKLPAINVLGWRCFRCLHEWVPEKATRPPKVCPGCKNPYWDEPRRDKGPL
jgi:hypothetical protein